MSEKQTVEMTAAELDEYNKFKEEKAKKEAEKQAAEQRKAYRQMVDDEIEASMPVLQALSSDIKDKKNNILDNFKAILEMKNELMMTKDGQFSHTFTNSKGTKRITLGVYTLDNYTDTVENGIAMVREYIESLATDDKTRMLVDSVLRLLSRDAKGTLKASRVMQLRKIANDSGNARFLEGVKIIEESYNPTPSRQFIRAEIKDENGAWKSVPLGMTES
ncbi:MAG: DUF3164 family protein [Bacteroidales bacterium]|nr:DUF3164 family protein [Bacteroidales bacterium]MBR6438025.1 DUF3164 family protein [Bacteroidales bacterium]